MSKESKGLKVLDKMGDISANVGMDEVVGVFLARWENTLYTEKDRLSKEIKGVKKELADHVKAVLDQFRLNTSQYEISVAVLGLRSRVTDVSLRWTQDDVGYGERKVTKPTARFSVEIKDTEKSEDRYSSGSFTKKFYQDISESDVERHNSLEEELSELGGRLAEILTKIKGVGRKERQVRGRIAEMKLERAGFQDLIENPDLVKLIKLED